MYYPPTYGIAPFTPTIKAPVLTTKVGAPATKGGFANGAIGLVSQVSAVAGFLKSIVGHKVVSKTIGQALKDGFDCWGSTWTPTRAKKELPSWVANIGGLYKQALTVPPENLEESVNDFFTSFWGRSNLGGTSLENWIGWRYDSAKDCTLRGLKALEKGIDAYVLELEANIKQVGPAIGAEVLIFKKTVTLHRRAHGKVRPYKKSVPQIKVKAIPVETKKAVSEGGTKTIDKTQPQKAGGSLIAFAALALWLGKKFIK